MRSWFLLLACAACADSAQDEVVVAQWDLDDPQSIRIPSFISSGQPATFTIVTHGNSCVSFHSTKVEVAEDVVDITPYNRRSSLDGFCEDIELTFEHAAEVVFLSPGRNLLRIHGAFDERGRVPIERDIVIAANGAQ